MKSLSYFSSLVYINIKKFKVGQLIENGRDAIFFVSEGLFFFLNHKGKRAQRITSLFYYTLMPLWFNFQTCVHHKVVPPGLYCVVFVNPFYLKVVPPGLYYVVLIDPFYLKIVPPELFYVVLIDPFYHQVVPPGLNYVVFVNPP